MKKSLRQPQRYSPNVPAILGWVIGVGALITQINFGPRLSTHNVEYVKEHAAATFDQSGFEIIGYQGYQMGGIIGKTYGGANVWYNLKRKPDNGIVYEAALQRWGDEIHIYNLKALDAIKP